MESTLSLILKHQKLLVSSHGTLVPLTLSLSQYLSLSLSPYLSQSLSYPAHGGCKAPWMWRRKCYYYLKRNLSAVNAPWRCDVRCNWSQKVQWLHMVGRMRGLQMNGKVPKVVASVLGFILSLLNLTGEILVENTIKYPKIEKNWCVLHFGTIKRSTWSCICQSDKSEWPGPVTPRPADAALDPITLWHPTDPTLTETYPNTWVEKYHRLRLMIYVYLCKCMYISMSMCIALRAFAIF